MKFRQVLPLALLCLSGECGCDQDAVLMDDVCDDEARPLEVVLDLYS
jgi:hypothetical protein